MPRAHGYTDPPYYITAYGIAVKHGYKGTEEEWINEIMNSARESSAAAAESAEDAAAAKLLAETARDQAQAARDQATAKATAASGSAGDAEAWAVGQRGGAAVGEADPAYHNNAKYYFDSLSNVVAAEVAADVGAWLAENVDPETEFVIDKSLTVANAAADAKRVGDKIAGLTDAFSKEKWGPTITESSYINSSSGVYTNSPSGKYCRTGLWSGVGYRIAVLLDSNDYEYGVFYYDETGSGSTGAGYIGYSGYATGVKYIPQNAVKFGVTFRRTDDAALTASDIAAIKAALYYYRPTDRDLVKRGFAADAEKTGVAVKRLEDAAAWNFREYPTGSLVVGGLNMELGTAQADRLDRARIAQRAVRRKMAVRLDDPNYTVGIVLYSENNRSSMTRSIDYQSAMPFILFEPEGNDNYFGIAINKVDGTDMTTDTTDPTSDWSIILREIKIYWTDKLPWETDSLTVFQSVKLKIAKEVPAYIDGRGIRYGWQGLCVTPKYVVVGNNSINTTAFPDVKDKYNAIMVFDRDTLELTEDLPENPVLFDFTSGDYPIESSHASNLAYYPDANEIYVRSGNGSSHYVLDADTFEWLRYGSSLGSAGGFAYDQTYKRWCFANYTGDDTNHMTWAVGIYDQLRTKRLTTLTPKKQNSLTQGCGFWDNLVFLLGNEDSSNRRNSVLVVDINGRIVASYWFEGAGEFEDIDRLSENTFILCSNNGDTRRLLVGAYKPYNVYPDEVKPWDIYYNSTIE